MTLFDADHWVQLYYLSEWTIRLVMLIYVPQRRSTAATRTWLLFIFLVPWFGLIFYMFFGRVYVPKRRIEEQDRASRHIRNIQQQQMASRIDKDLRLPDSLASAATLASTLGDFHVFGGNRLELLSEYVVSIDRLIADIDAAQKHVNLLYYIFEADPTGERVTDALVRARQRGVHCRVLMDAVGSKRGLKYLAPKMRAVGIEVHAALPVGLLRRNTARFDLRNHRKIAVIDGFVGFTGSQNIVDAMFVPDYPNEELVVRVTGPVVAQLQAVFLMDYFIETGVVEQSKTLFPELNVTGASPAQVVPSGPGYRRENGQELMIALLYAAKKRVVITTPYFVPDEIFLQALRAATLRGVAVHLVLSKHSNQRLTHLAQCSYYDSLLEAGVRVHLYKPKFLHAKHLTIDDNIAFIGSTNIDIRSFALNAEINLLAYDEAVVRQLQLIQERYFAHSDLLTEAEWSQRSLGLRTIQNIARLADSLL
ncbi:MAG TPA: cardiolipin synthase [Pseudomonadales bacterium]|nr:cardiolipin synthase [Pseudomonadales bacterium]